MFEAMPRGDGVVRCSGNGVLRLDSMQLASWDVGPIHTAIG